VVVRAAALPRFALARGGAAALPLSSATAADRVVERRVIRFAGGGGGDRDADGAPSSDERCRRRFGGITSVCVCVCACVRGWVVVVVSGCCRRRRRRRRRRQ